MSFIKSMFGKSPKNEDGTAAPEMTKEERHQQKEFEKQEKQAAKEQAKIEKQQEKEMAKAEKEAEKAEKQQAKEQAKLEKQQQKDLKEAEKQQHKDIKEANKHADRDLRDNRDVGSTRASAVHPLSTAGYPAEGAIAPVPLQGENQLAAQRAIATPAYNEQTPNSQVFVPLVQKGVVMPDSYRGDLNRVSAPAAAAAAPVAAAPIASSGVPAAPAVEKTHSPTHKDKIASNAPIAKHTNSGDVLKYPGAVVLPAEVTAAAAQPVNYQVKSGAVDESHVIRVQLAGNVVPLSEWDKNKLDKTSNFQPLSTGSQHHTASAAPISTSLLNKDFSNGEQKQDTTSAISPDDRPLDSFTFVCREETVAAAAAAKEVEREIQESEKKHPIFTSSGSSSAFGDKSKEQQWGRTGSDAPSADILSRDRDYNYGQQASFPDVMKDKLGVANSGAQKPSTAEEARLGVSSAQPFNAAGNVSGASTFSRDRDYDHGLKPSMTDKVKDTLGVANVGPQGPHADILSRDRDANYSGQPSTVVRKDF